MMLRECVSLLAVAASCTLAQEALFLEPADATVAVGDGVLFSAVAGNEAQAWPTDRVEHFFARTAWTQENRDTLEAGETLTPLGAQGGVDVPLGAEAVETIAVWPAELPGVLMLGCDFSPRLETVGADSFRAFVERVLPTSRVAGLGLIPAEGEVTIRRVESVKALVLVEAEGAHPASIATSKTGQVVEIRALFDPTAVAIGSDLAVKVYAALPGPAEGVVIATNTTTGEVTRAITNASATAVITITGAGRWQLEFHAVSSIDDSEAAWEVHTATLTFDVAGVEDGTNEGEVTK